MSKFKRASVVFLPAASVWLHLLGGQQRSRSLNVIWTLDHEDRKDAVTGEEARDERRRLSEGT